MAMPRADIVVKLRAQRDFADDWRTTLAEEAADNIERLRSDVAAYKKDFRSIAEALNDPRCDLTHTMAELVAELRAELAECKEQKDKWIIAAANAENSRDEAWRELDAAVRHCCGNYREGYDAAHKGEGE